jgi:thiamine pyrophosphate-dependent acetolactate synthase large subunit-like protein
MARIVADQIVSALVHAGVKRIYGIVGDSLIPSPTPFVVTEASIGS